MLLCRARLGMGDWLPRDGMSTMPWMWSLVSCSFLFASLREIKVKFRMKDEKNLLQQLKLFLKIVVLIHIFHHSLLLTENISRRKVIKSINDLSFYLTLSAL